VDAVLSKAGVVIPVAPVNPGVEASPPLEPTPSVVNHVNPALHAQQALPNEGEANFTSVQDPVKASASTQRLSHDWTIHRPAPEKVENPPPKPISQMLMEHLKSMWTASASAVQVEQVSNQLSRPAPTQPTQIAGDLAKQVLTYQPTRIKKNEKI
jgi:cell division septation protein DedD